VVPYLKMVTRNGLAEVAEGTVVRYRTTANGKRHTHILERADAKRF